MGIIERNSKRFKKRFRASSNKSLIDMTAYLKERVLKNMSRTDFSLEELREKDHPYATRHGERILTGKLGMPFNDNQSYLIHERTGAMKKDLKVKKNKAEGSASLFFTNQSGHTRFVVEGTRTLLPRDVIAGTASLKGVQKKLFSIARKNFKAMVKSYGK
ncbi:MAG: hypothetical protein ACR2M6_02405 [Vampirovibrionia bacterium]